jgi:hypothetical protein
MIRRLLREPLLQFVLVGVLLFGAWEIARPDSQARSQGNRIVLTADDLGQLRLLWVAQGRPPPTPEQMQELVEMKVREEVLYREALALGLDKDDTIVKRQLARKMDFLAEDLSKLDEPHPGELRSWYDDNAARFALPPRITFRHVYFSPDRRGANARADAERALARLPGKAVEAGDPFMFQSYYADRAFDTVAKEFGPRFARALVGVKPRAWTGPVESGYGWHLVFVESTTAERVPPFDEIEADVKAAWIEQHRSVARDRMYAEMRARYEIVVPAMPDADRLATTRIR